MDLLACKKHPIVLYFVVEEVLNTNTANDK